MKNVRAGFLLSVHLSSQCLTRFLVSCGVCFIQWIKHLPKGEDALTGTAQVYLCAGEEGKEGRREGERGRERHVNIYEVCP